MLIDLEGSDAMNFYYGNCTCNIKANITIGSHKFETVDYILK